MQASASFAGHTAGRVVLLPLGLTSPGTFASVVAALLSADGLHAPLAELSVDDDLLRRAPALRPDLAALTFDACLEPPSGSADDADAEHLYPGRAVVRAVLGVVDAAAHNEGQLAQIAREFPADAARIHRQWGSPSAAEPVARLLVLSATEHHLEHSAFFGPHCRFIMHGVRPPGAPPPPGGVQDDDSSSTTTALAMHLRLEMGQVASLVLARYSDEISMFASLEEGAGLSPQHAAALGGAASAAAAGSGGASSAPAPAASSGGSSAAATAAEMLKEALSDALAGGLAPGAFSALLGGAATPAHAQAVSSVRCGRLDLGLTHGLGGVSAAFGAVKKRLNGRLAKHRADVLLLAGAPHDAVDAADRACKVLRGANDYLFAGLAEETRAAALHARRALERRAQRGGDYDAEYQFGDLSAAAAGAAAAAAADDSDSPFQPAVAAALRDAIGHFDALAASLQAAAASASPGGAGGAAAAAGDGDAAAAPAPPAQVVSPGGVVITSAMPPPQPPPSSSAGAAAALSGPGAPGSSFSSSSAAASFAYLTDVANQLVATARIRLAAYLLQMAAPPQRALTALCAVTGAPGGEDGSLYRWWSGQGLELTRPTRAALRTGAAAAAHERSRTDATLVALSGGGIGGGASGGATTVDTNAEAAAAVFVAQRTASALRVINTSADLGPPPGSGVGRSTTSSSSADGGGGPDGVDSGSPSSSSQLGALQSKLTGTLRKAKESVAAAAAAAAAALDETSGRSGGGGSSSSGSSGGGGGLLTKMNLTLGVGGGGRGGKAALPGPLEFSDALMAAVARVPSIRIPQAQVRVLLLAADLFECAGLWRRADVCVTWATRRLRTLHQPLGAEAFRRRPAADASQPPPPPGGCIYSLAAAPPSSSESPAAPAGLTSGPQPWPLPWVLGGGDVPAAAPGARPLSSSAATSQPSLSSTLLVGPGWMRFRPALAAGLLSLTVGLRDPALLAQVLPLHPGDHRWQGTGSRLSTWLATGRDSGTSGGGPSVLLPATSLTEWCPMVVSDLWQAGELPLAVAVAAIMANSESTAPDGANGWRSGEADIRLPSSTAVLRGLPPAVVTAQAAAAPAQQPAPSSASATPARSPVLSTASTASSTSTAGGARGSTHFGAPPPASQQLSSALRRLGSSLRNRRALSSATGLSLYDASPLIAVRTVLAGTTIPGRMSRLDALVALQLLSATAAEAAAAAAHSSRDAAGSVSSSGGTPAPAPALPVSSPARGGSATGGSAPWSPAPASPASASAPSTTAVGAPTNQQQLRQTRLPRHGGLLAALHADLCCAPGGSLVAAVGDADVALGAAVVVTSARPGVPSQQQAGSTQHASGAPASAAAAANGNINWTGLAAVSSTPFVAPGGGEAWTPRTFLQALSSYLLTSSGGCSGNHGTRRPDAPAPAILQLVQRRQARAPGGDTYTLTRPVHTPFLPVPLVTVAGLSWCVSVPAAVAPSAAAAGNSASSSVLVLSEYAAAPPWVYAAAAAAADGSGGVRGGGASGPLSRAAQAAAAAAATAASDVTILLEKEGSGVARSRARMIDATATPGAAAPAVMASRSYVARDPAEMLCLGLTLTAGRAAGPVAGLVAVQLEACWAPATAAAQRPPSSPSAAAAAAAAATTAAGALPAAASSPSTPSQPMPPPTVFRSMSALVPFAVQPRGQARVLTPLRVSAPAPPPVAAASTPPPVYRLLLRATGMLVLSGPLLLQLPLDLRPAPDGSGASGGSGGAPGFASPTAAYTSAYGGPASAAAAGGIGSGAWEVDFTLPPHPSAAAARSGSSSSGGGGALDFHGRAPTAAQPQDVSAAHSQPHPTAPQVVGGAARRGSSFPAQLPSPGRVGATHSAAGGAATATGSTGGVVIYGSSWAQIPSGRSGRRQQHHPHHAHPQQQRKPVG